MNKTLLLILVDFLLLTILSMWKWEEEAPSSQAEDGTEDAAREESVAAMAMMEKDLLDTLQYSLEEEQSEQASLARELEEREAALREYEATLRERESSIEDLQDTLTAAERRELELQREREAAARQAQELAQQVEATRQEYELATRQLSETEMQARQNEAQARLLQEELERRMEELERKEAALSQTNEQLNAAQQQMQDLNVRVQLTEREKQFLEESVSSLKGEVVAERTERQRLQEQAGVLAQGVTELAESSQDLREEIRSNTEINANQLFSDFRNNQITATFSAVVYSRNRYVETNQSASTVLATDGQNTFALMHVDSLPFGLNSNVNLIRSVEFALSRSGTTITPRDVQFLALDPRIVAVPLTESEVEQLGGQKYLTALKPFRFPEAVLVNKQGDYYGEVEFKLDSSTPGFVKMQTKIFSAIFGEFSPSTGDLVLSKTGELLGVMVNRQYCVLINNFVVSERLTLDGAIDKPRFERVLERLNNTLKSFPRPLR